MRCSRQSRSSLECVSRSPMRLWCLTDTVCVYASQVLYMYTRIFVYIIVVALPLFALCSVACVDALLYATGRVAVIIRRLPIARPRLLTMRHSAAVGSGMVPLTQPKKRSSFFALFLCLSAHQMAANQPIAALRSDVNCEQEAGPMLVAACSRWIVGEPVSRAPPGSIGGRAEA